MNVFNHIAGGVLMGLANLVPGISGGTMLLAAGVYRSLIDAVGQLCRLNITKRSLAPVVWIAIPATVTIISLAGIVSGLVLNHRPLAYATFIGLTLGGIVLVKGSHKSVIGLALEPVWDVSLVSVVSAEAVHPVWVRLLLWWFWVIMYEP